MLGAERKKSKAAASCVAECNVCILIDRSSSHYPERQAALVVMEMNKYNVTIAALSETRPRKWVKSDKQGKKL